MPNLTASNLTELSDLTTMLCASMSVALSEQINGDISIEVTQVTTIPIQQVLDQDDSVVSTVFSMSPPLSQESLFVLYPDIAGMVADVMAGGEGKNLPETLTDEQITLLATSLQAGLRGLATAIAGRADEAIEIEACSSQFGALTLPPVFALDGNVVEVQLSVSLLELTDAKATFLLTPEWAQTLLSLLTTAPPPPAARSEDTLDEDELAAMLNDIGGLSNSASMPGMPAPSSNAPPFSNFPTSSSDSAMPRGMEMILDIPLDVTVELGRVRMLIKDVLELASGSIVELDRVAGEPVDVLVNGRLVAKGEVVVIEDNFGIRITEIVSQADRLAGLGKGR